jgi:tetratricopeptide (TPR) repeat protein
VRFLRTLALASSLFVGAPVAHADPPTDLELAELDARLAESPTDLEALLARAELRGVRGEPALALVDLRVASALAPHEPRIAPLRAEALVALDQPDAALAELDAALATGRASRRTRALRARVLARLGRSSEAIEAWDAALELAPDPDGYLERGRLLERASRSEEALLRYREGVTATGGAAVLRLAVVDLASRLGQHDVALAELDALARAGGEARWLAMRGEVLARAGRATEARTAFERALAASAQALAQRPSAAHRVDAARALLGLGRADEAASECARALALAPDYAPARELLARARRQGGAR